MSSCLCGIWLLLPGDDDVLNKFTYKKQRGFTFLELIAVVIVVSLLTVFVFDRVLPLRVAAEKASVIQIVGNIKSALGLEVVRLALRGNMSAIADLENKNPIPLLAQVPTNYLGESEKEISTEGSWYFNKSKRTLIYNIKFKDSFSSTVKGQPRIRHIIKLIYNDNNHNQHFDVEYDNISGLDLTPLERFHWTIKS